MSESELATLQVKLTYVGPQRDVISTVAFTSASNSLNLSLFAPFRRSGVFYANDNAPFNSFRASTAELRAVIDNVALLPNVTAGGVAENRYLSFAMLNTVGATKVFEAVLSLPDASDLFGKLRLALQNNNEGLKRLSEMACAMNILESQRPTDVSAQVSVALSGVRINRSTGRFVGKATVRNTSAASISGPLSLVLDLRGNVSLVNANGATCGTSPQGREFINFPLVGNALGAGDSAQVTLEFSSPDAESIKPTTKVLAGPGAR